MRYKKWPKHIKSSDACYLVRKWGVSDEEAIAKLEGRLCLIEESPERIAERKARTAQLKRESRKKTVEERRKELEMGRPKKTRYKDHRIFDVRRGIWLKPDNPRFKGFQ